MRRHIENKHSKESLSKVASGKCLCFQCGFKCHRIVELRKHLVEKHSFVTENETLKFDNMKGGILITVVS